MPNEPSHRTRFLIALAKFFGESPKEKKPLESIQVCDDWLLDEILNSIVKEHAIELTLERFNQLMINCGRRMATPHFFRFFFAEVRSIEIFEEAVERFRIKSMWLFGNFRFGYKRLATTSQPEFERLIALTEDRDPAFFEQREPFTDIEDIEEEALEFLGYISGVRLDDLDFAAKTVDALASNISSAAKLLSNIGSARQEKMARLLKTELDIAFPETGMGELTEEQLSQFSSQIHSHVEPLRARQKNAIDVGKQNTQRYLALPHLDVYVATSMRTKEDFLSQRQFIKELFRHQEIENLKLRFFDPTLSYVEDRITKGLVEMLMLQRASVTIYNAGAEDTFGKDCEVASTLAQGKAVIVYVPAEPASMKLADGRIVDMNRRAEVFKVGHPLGLQIDVRTGVAQGIIVVRSVDECAKMLRKVMLRERRFEILHERGNFLLSEKETGSILRVVSDDPFLTHSFWTYFNSQKQSPEE